MTDLPQCPCCGKILNVPPSYKLSSACRCGYPERVDWDNFPDREPEQLVEVEHLGPGRIAA